MGFSRQEYWSGLPWPPPGDLPDSGIEPASPVAPALQAHSLPLSQRGNPHLSLVLCENETLWDCPLLLIRTIKEGLSHLPRNWSGGIQGPPSGLRTTL